LLTTFFCALLLPARMERHGLRAPGDPAVAGGGARPGADRLAGQACAGQAAAPVLEPLGWTAAGTSRQRRPCGRFVDLREYAMAPAAEEEEEEEGKAELVEEEKDDEEGDDPSTDVQRFMESMVSGGDDRTKEEALDSLKRLYIKFKCGFGITCAMLHAGVLKPLIGFVEHGTDRQKEQAAELISTLAYTSRVGLVSDSGVKIAVRNLGGFKALATLLQKGEDKQQENAAAALENLAVTAADRSLLAEAFGGCVGLVSLVKRGSGCQKELAVRILRNMLVDGHPEAVEEASAVVTAASRELQAREADGQMLGAPDISVC